MLLVISNGKLENGISKIDSNVLALTFDSLRLRELFPTPMKTSTQLLRKTTRRAIPSLKLDCEKARSRFNCTLCAMNPLDDKLVTIHRAIAEYYWHDARDFLARFNALWETETHKTGRIKTFVDLLMACECALKSHAMLGREEKECPVETYKKVRRAGHKIDELADLASLNPDRHRYNFVKKELKKFSVFIRYTLEAYDMFFPAMLDNWEKAKVNHSKTIANYPWVVSIRDSAQALVDELNPYFTGSVANDIEKIFALEMEMLFCTRSKNDA